MCPTDKKDLENLYSGNSFRNFQLNVVIMKLKHDFFNFMMTIAVLQNN